MSASRTFVGFGFGAIQGGLFLREAYRSGNFSRLVVVEVVPEMVRMLRESGGRYRINVATASAIEVHEVHGVEAYHPAAEADRDRLLEALAEADEIATALPSVGAYNDGANSVARWLSQAVRFRGKPGIVYTAENHNRAAELLEEAVQTHGVSTARHPLVYLNTVIGKMSRVVTDAREIAEAGLAPLVAGMDRALLVEEFNRILISRIPLESFERGISVFEEKDDLLPFEEAKLYGHNAVHALLGFMAHQQGLRFMSEIAREADLVRRGQEAFLLESGRAMLNRHEGVDPLFTTEGYRAYAEDLLRRMMNPFLRDAVERVIRDPVRKLGWDDRLIGTMRRAMAAGVNPRLFARGARLALDMLARASPGRSRDALLAACWSNACADSQAARIKELIQYAA